MASIVDIIADTLGIPADEVVDDLAFQAIPEWDSLAHVSLMLRVEEFCRTPVTGDLVVKLTSVAAIRVFDTECSRNRAGTAESPRGESSAC